MARQFSTFSVVDILGHGVPNSDEHPYPLQASAAPLSSSSQATKDQDCRSTATTAPVSLFLRPGTVNQMLPPLPAAPTLHYDQHLLSRQTRHSDETENETRVPTKKGRKGKKPLKRNRISSDADDSLKSPVLTIATDGEDDVFFNNHSSNSSRRRLSAARTSRDRGEPLPGLSVPARAMNSAGETPSPPAGTSATSAKKQEQLGKLCLLKINVYTYFFSLDLVKMCNFSWLTFFYYR